MGFLASEQPPVGTDENLTEYLARMFSQIDIALANSGSLSKRNIAPGKPIIGKIYYFNIAIPAHPVITAEGYYGFKSTGWVFIA